MWTIEEFTNSFIDAIQEKKKKLLPVEKLTPDELETLRSVVESDVLENLRIGTLNHDEPMEPQVKMFLTKFVLEMITSIATDLLN